MARKNNTPEVPKNLGGAKQGVKIGVVMAFVLVISVGILFLANKSITDRRSEALDNQEKRLGLLAHGRVEMVKEWLRNLSHQGDRLIKSDLFRLYASEVDSIEGDLAAIFGAVAMEEEEIEEEGAELAAQLPMMQNMLREFSTYSGFSNARILNREGEAYIATDGHLPPMSDDQLDLAQESVKTKKPVYSPFRKTPQGLALDVYVPIFSPDAREDMADAIGALMMTRQVAGKITDLMANSALSAKGERTRFMQRKAGKFFEVTPWTSEGFTAVTAQIVLGQEGDLPFGDRTSLSEDDREVYSLGVAIPGSNWWVVQESDYNKAMRPIEAYARTVYIVAAWVSSRPCLLPDLHGGF